ncbi:MAG TPA: hypothetical protein VMW62_08505 [Chloroflexota bacterium]|nr:hypothetical protein [Chloroflexota bacterium]
MSLASGLAPAYAAGAGVITGALVEKTAGATLQGGATAYLYKLASGQNPQQAGQVAVDAAGSFRFDSLDTDAGVTYEVGAQYQGAPYFSDKLSFGPGEATRSASLDVYEATDDDKTLSLAGTSLLVDPNDKTHDLAILELDRFVVHGQRTFVPNTIPRNGGPPPLLRFSLPPNATDLTPSQGMSPDEVIQIATGFGAMTPLLPGPHDLGFSFRSAYQTSSTSFSKSVIYPTTSLRVLMPVDAGRIESPQLQRQAVQNIGGKQYQLLAASNLQPGSKIDLRFSGLPGINPFSQLAQPSTLPWLASVLGLIVLGLMGWYVRDRRRAPAAAAAPDHQGLESERRELLIALARLDDRHDAGAVSEQDYRAQRDEQKAELRAVIQRLEGSG